MAVGALLEDDSDAPTTEAAAVSSTEQPSPEPSPKPSSKKSPEPAPEPEEELATSKILEILTVDDSPDLASILHVPDYCGQQVADFAGMYPGETIQFDGHIGAMNTHGSYGTHYDILISPRDFNESDGRGPAFQFRNVNLTSNLELTGRNISGTSAVNDTLRLTAVVGEFEENTCLLLLDPVSTEMR